MNSIRPRASKGARLCSRSSVPRHSCCSRPSSAWLSWWTPRPNAPVVVVGAAREDRGVQADPRVLPSARPRAGRARLSDRARAQADRARERADRARARTAQGAPASDPAAPLLPRGARGTARVARVRAATARHARRNTARTRRPPPGDPPRLTVTKRPAVRNPRARAMPRRGRAMSLPQAVRRARRVSTGTRAFAPTAKEPCRCAKPAAREAPRRPSISRIGARPARACRVSELPHRAGSRVRPRCAPKPRADRRLARR